jgi:hypothetical protein
MTRDNASESVKTAARAIADDDSDGFAAERFRGFVTRCNRGLIKKRSDAVEKYKNPDN